MPINPRFMPSPRWRKRLLWSAVTLALLAALLAALCAWWLPGWLKGKAEIAGTEALGRPVSIGRIEINPFLLRAKVFDVRIAEAGGSEATDFVRVGEVLVDAQIRSLFYRAAIVREIAVREPYIHLQRTAAARFNFSDILERLAAQPKSPESEPLRFSLNNIQLSGGEIAWQDDVENSRHSLREITIGVPFASNLETYIESFVTPQLAAKFDDQTLRIDGRVLPFTDHRAATLDLKLDALDLTRFTPYLPDDMPLKLQKGALSLALQLNWSEAGKTPSLILSGTSRLADLRLANKAAKPLLAWQSLDVDIANLHLLAQPMRGEIRQVLLAGADVSLLRDADGTLNLPDFAAKPAASNKPAPKTTAPQIKIASIELRDGALNWQDAAVPGKSSFKLAPIDAQLSGLDLAGGKAATLKLSATGDAKEQLSQQGSLSLSPLAAQGEIKLAGVLIERLKPYLAGVLPQAQLAGKLAVQSQYKFASNADGMNWSLNEGGLQLADFALRRAADKASATPLLQIGTLATAGLAADSKTRSASIKNLSIARLNSRASRSKDGSIDVAQVLQPATSPSTASPAKTQTTNKPEAPWQVSLAQLRISDSGARYEDRSGDKPITMLLAGLSLSADDISTAAKAQSKFDLRTRVNKSGRLQVAGNAGWNPVRGDLKVVADKLDILPIQPFIDDHFRVLITQGALSAKGNLRFDMSDAAKPQTRWAGDVALTDFNARDTINDTDFMRFGRFAVNGAEAVLAPQSFSAQEVALSDFSSRLILDAQGKLNLRELTQAQAAEQDAALAAVAPKPVADSPTTSRGQTTLEAPAPLPPIRIDKIVLASGEVSYSDRFVRPHYDAQISELGGTLSGLASAPGTLAELALNGKVDRVAPLSISGTLNPLRQDKYLDIKAQVRDVDLTSVSTYAAKFAGYGITKGRLSANLGYQVKDRKLTANNQILLNQLSFGDKVDSPDATKLPVLFAVNLLRDRNGDIDLNLPISGSLDDPEFSVGGIVVKVIVNLLTRAVTSPFSLLASLAGGNAEELAYVDFAPGTASLSAAATEKLQSVAKILAQRPAIKMELTGRVDRATEAEALAREKLRAQMRTLKAQALVAQGQSVATVDSLDLSTAEYQSYLAALYKSTPMKKPSNAVGLNKTLAPLEMEALLLTHYAASEADFTALARSRAQSVRNWLVERGELSTARVFVVNAPSSEKPAARVDFSLQ